MSFRTCRLLHLHPTSTLLNTLILPLPTPLMQECWQLLWGRVSVSRFMFCCHPSNALTLWRTNGKAYTKGNHNSHSYSHHDYSHSHSEHPHSPHYSHYKQRGAGSPETPKPLLCCSSYPWRLWRLPLLVRAGGCPLHPLGFTAANWHYALCCVRYPHHPFQGTKGNHNAHPYPHHEHSHTHSEHPQSPQHSHHKQRGAGKSHRL